MLQFSRRRRGGAAQLRPRRATPPTVSRRFRARIVRRLRSAPLLATASVVLAFTFTAALVGVAAELVRVEADVSFGLPRFTIVGLPDASVRESRDRVRSAIRSAGLEFPPHRITVNLAPADLRKAGSSFDLPIALAVLAAGGQLPPGCRPEPWCSGNSPSTAGPCPVAAYCRPRSRHGRQRWR